MLQLAVINLRPIKNIEDSSRARSAEEAVRNILYNNKLEKKYKNYLEGTISFETDNGWITHKVVPLNGKTVVIRKEEYHLPGLTEDEAAVVKNKRTSGLPSIIEDDEGTLYYLEGDEYVSRYERYSISEMKRIYESIRHYKE